MPLVTVKDEQGKPVGLVQDDLTRKLITEISTDPQAPEAAARAIPFLSVCREAEKWYEAAKGDSPFADAIKNAATELLNAKNSNPLLFGIQMVQKVGHNLETAAPEMRKQFADFVKERSTDIQASMNQLASLNIDNTLTQHAKLVSDGFISVSNELTDWSRVVTQANEAIVRLPLPDSVKNFLGSVNEIVQFGQRANLNFREGIDNVMGGLWGKVTAGINTAENLNDTIKALRVQLNETQDDVAKIGIEENIKVVEKLIGQQASGMNKTLQGIEAGFQAAGMIVGLCGDSRLAGDIVMVGEAAVSIAGSLAVLYAGSTLGGPAMPVIAIAGTVIMLAAHFLGGGGGEQRDDIILKQLNNLSQHMDARFDRIEVMLEKSVNYLAEHIDNRIQALTDHLDDRLDKISKDIECMATDIIHKFSKIHVEVRLANETILTRLDRLQQSIDYLHRDFSAALKAQYEAAYLRDFHDAFTPIANAREMKQREIDRELKKYYTTFISWIAPTVDGYGVKAPQISGRAQGDGLVEAARRIGGNGNDGDPYPINQIMDRAVRLTADSATPIVNPGLLSNPGALADGIRTLIAFFAKNPRLFQIIIGVDDDRTLLCRDIRRVKRECDNIENSMIRIQGSDVLFKKLIESYAEKLTNVVQFIYEQAVYIERDEIVGDKSVNPEDALDRVAGIKNIKSLIAREYKTTAAQTQVVDTFVLPMPTKDDMKYRTINENESAKNQHYHNVGLATDNSTINLVVGATFDQLKFTCIARDHHIEREKTFEKNANELSAYINRLNQHSILDNAEHRNKRILTIIADASVDELRACRIRPIPLPHRKLMEQYFEVRTHQAMNRRFIDNEITKAALNDRLDDLDKAVDEISIFLSYAFPKQFISDPRLRVFLGTLWSKQSILDHMMMNKRDFIAVALQKSLEPGRELDRFRADILGRVEAAKMGRELGFVDEYRHPLIQKVSSELAVFEKVAELATKAPVQARNNEICVFHPIGKYMEIQDNGNSFFRAVAYQLNNPDIDHAQLRAIAIDYMQGHEQDFITKFNNTKEDFDRYIFDMKKEGVNADDVIITALALQQNVRLIIMDDRKDRRTQQRQYGFIDVNETADKEIYLLALNNNCYHAFHPDLDTLKDMPEYQLRISGGLIKGTSDRIKIISEEMKAIENNIKFLSELDSLSIEGNEKSQKPTGEKPFVMKLFANNSAEKPNKALTKAATPTPK